MRKKIWQEVIVFSYIIISLIIFIFLFEEIYFLKTQLKYVKKISIIISNRITEKEVINILGKPDQVFYKGDEEKFEYGSYKPIPVEPILNKVLIYNIPLSERVYIFIDQEGKVSRIYWAST